MTRTFYIPSPRDDVLLYHFPAFSFTHYTIWSFEMLTRLFKDKTLIYFSAYFDIYNNVLHVKFRKKSFL